jgi:putative ABC transport system permease protein
MAAFQSRSYNLSDEGEPERLVGAATTANLFALLGRPPVLGRDFRPDEDDPGAPAVVILSDALWQRRFAGDPAIVGSTIRLDAVAHTVVGIAQPSFFFPGPETDAWVPAAFPTEPDARGNRSFAAVARLADGVTIDQAKIDLVRIAEELDREFPTDNAGWRVDVIPAMEELLGEEVPQFFLLLMLSVACVALIACANIASLLLSRAVIREREVSLRTVLGATRGRLLRQLLTEALVLAAAGGAVGIAAAYPAVKLLLLIAPQDAPRLANVAIDGTVLVYAALITLGTAIVFGLVPALQASKPDLHAALKGAARTTAGAPRHRLLRGLVAAEVALATTLVALGVLTVRSVQELLRQDPGFHHADLLTFQLNLPETKYPDSPSRAAFFRRLLDELRALPGVETASAVQTLPLSGSNSWRGVTVEGIPLPAPDERESVGYLQVGDQYFETLDVAVLRGRSLSAADVAEGANVIAVNQAFVERYWPRGEDPIGRRVKFGWDPVVPEDPAEAVERPWLTIVGVAANIRHSGLDDEPRPEIYVPYANDAGRGMAVVVETTAGGDPAALATMARRTVSAVDPDQSVYNVRTITEMLDRGGSIGGTRAIAQILGTLALGAIVLAAIGIYGVITFTTSQRQHEIGIRRAVGAGARDIVALTLRQALVPVTYALAVGGLLAVAIAAGVLPARRATLVDPLVVLRHD